MKYAYLMIAAYNWAKQLKFGVVVKQESYGK